MKKCNRCNNVIDWDKPFCPLCGGQVIDTPRSERIEPVGETIQAAAEKMAAQEVAMMVEPPSPPAPQLPPAPITAVPPPPASPIQAATMIPPIPSPIPPTLPPPPFQPQAFTVEAPPTLSSIPGVPAFPQDSAIPPLGSISQIHDTDVAADLFTPPPPSNGVISQIHQSPDTSLSPDWPEEPSSGINQQEDLSTFL